MGRPKHEWNADFARTIASLTSVGIPVAVVAKCLDISEDTLRKYYIHELTNARDIANGQVTNTLYRMATSGRHPAATFFWLKCQAGWREVVTIDHTGGSLSDIAKLLNDE